MKLKTFKILPYASYLAMLITIILLAFLNIGLERKETQKSYDEIILMFDQGNKAEAIKELEVLYNQEHSKDYAFRLAQYYYQNNQLERFIRLVEEAELESELICNMRGDYYHSKGEFDKALIYYQRAVELSTKGESSYVKLAAYYQQRGLLAEAKDTIEDGLLKNPSSIKLLITLSSIYAKMGDSTKSKFYANEALKIQPGNTQAQSLANQ